MSDWKIEEQIEYHVYCGDDFRGDFASEAEAKSFIEGFKSGIRHRRIDPAAGVPSYLSEPIPDELLNRLPNASAEQPD